MYDDPQIKEILDQIMSSTFPDAEIDIQSMDTRVLISIKDKIFNDMTHVKRHRMVYNALGGLPSYIHSLRIEARAYNE